MSGGCLSSREVVSRVNDVAVRTIPERYFATIWYGVYDATTGMLTYTNAGHHPALVVRDGDVIKTPLSPGLPLGLFSSDITAYGECQFQLRRGDRLCVFTDAAFEVMNADRTVMGMNRLCAVLANNAGLPANLLIDAVKQHCLDFAGTPFDDDFTFLIFDKD
jgi:sigma-B regulation protein RsbU (phosphoserine phosphatase)